MASDSQGGQQQNMEIIQVISFIEETMQKLKNIWRKIQITARFKSDPIGSVVNLSNKTFTKDDLKFYIKTLISYQRLKQTTNNFPLK